MHKYNFYTTQELKPKGWLLNQLRLQANSLSGNLDKVWNDVKNSAWIGGDAEGWERVPYWLDGFIPLAYLLNDEDLISRAQKYVKAIVNNQEEDGWICPCSKENRKSYDAWAVLLISKVLTVYAECSLDKDIPKVIFDLLSNLYTLLKNGEIKLFDWGKYRWFEGLIAIEFTLKHYNEEWLYDLAKLLKEQGIDYKSVTNLWERPLNKWTLDTHIVNICMALKGEALYSSLFGNANTSEVDYLLSVLQKYNSTPVGIFTGDECLSGLSPIQGTELCAVVEQMYSYELLYKITGQARWAEMLELVSFNALPATISDDMWAHQYVQMSNQIACKKFPGKPIFRTNGDESHLFGLEPNYGCCTANFNQGWPKLALSAFAYNENEVISVTPLPTKLSTNDFNIEVITEYPFKKSINYKISAKKPFVFSVRLPSFIKNLTVDGMAYKTTNENISFNIEKGKREIAISFEVEPEIISRPYGLNCVKYGSLIFALPIEYKKVMLEYERKGVERKFPYCDYEYLPLSDFNYALFSKKLTVEEGKVDALPFSSQNPPIVIKCEAVKIDWGYEDGYDSVCAKIPNDLTPISNIEEKQLYPYGCAKLRITEIPFAKK